MWKTLYIIFFKACIYSFFFLATVAWVECCCELLLNEGISVELTCKTNLYSDTAKWILYPWDTFHCIFFWPYLGQHLSDNFWWSLQNTVMNVKLKKRTKHKLSVNSSCVWKCNARIKHNIGIVSNRPHANHQSRGGSKSLNDIHFL